MITPRGEVGNGKRGARGEKLAGGVIAGGDADSFEARRLPRFYIQRCIADYKNVRLRNRSAIFVGRFFRGPANQLSSILRIGPETAKFKVAVEAAALEFNPGATFDISSGEPKHDVVSAEHLFE